MIKGVSVTYNVDTESGEVTGLICKVGEAIAKQPVKRATASTSKKEDNESDPKVRLESNKLVINSKAVDALKAEYGCRVAIKYQVVDNKRIPIIGTDGAWDEEGSGNKITKANTVAYKGNQNTILAEYGSEFDLVDHGDELFKLIPVDGIPDNVGVPTEPKKKKTSSKVKKDEGPKTKIVDVDMSEIEEMSRNMNDADGGEIDDFSFSM